MNLCEISEKHQYQINGFTKTGLSRSDTFTGAPAPNPTASELGSCAVTRVPSFKVILKRHDAPRKLAENIVALLDLLATT
jgi:hypothetical protein